MTEDNEKHRVAQLSGQIIDLIFDRQYERAAAMIEAKDFPDDEAHRLTALSAVLQRETGNLHEGINLMQQAKRDRPTWLPHLYRLAVLYMDAERWLDANAVLDELVSLSEKNNDTYFVDEARFRKIVCLKALGREDEIRDHKAKISADAAVYIGDRYYRLDDFN